MKTQYKIRVIFLIIMVFFCLIASFGNNPGNGYKSPKNYFKTKKNYYKGVSIGTMGTASLHGAEGELNFVFKSGRNMFETGMLFQNFTNLTGTQVRYKIIINSDDPWVQAYFTANVAYHHNASLSKRATEAIYSRSKEKNDDKYRTIEEYVGIGLTIHTRLNVDLDMNIGGGSFQSKILTPDNRPENYGFLRPDVGMGLNLKIGLIYRF